MSIFNIQPHQVSKDLRGYSVLFYGEPKSGKTSTAVKFPKHLLLAFEKGYAAIPGAMALPINTWGEFLKALRELKKPEAKETYETIIIDTADIAYDLCERYICAQHDVDAIGDIPYGKGYSLVAQEFDEKLRSIVQMDFGLVLISHAQDKTFKDEQEQEYQKIVPTLPNKAQTIVSRMCDIIGYSRAVNNPETGLSETRLFMRGTPRYVAGSRFTHTPDSIVFNYANLVAAISDAVEKLEQEFGSDAVTTVRHNKETALELRPIEEIKDEFNSLAAELMSADPDFYGPRIQQAVETHFGKGKKISEATIDQAELAELVIDDIKAFMKK